MCGANKIASSSRSIWSIVLAEPDKFYSHPHKCLAIVKHTASKASNLNPLTNKSFNGNRTHIKYLIIPLYSPEWLGIRSELHNECEHSIKRKNLKYLLFTFSSVCSEGECYVVQSMCAQFWHIMTNNSGKSSHSTTVDKCFDSSTLFIVRWMDRDCADAHFSVVEGSLSMHKARVNFDWLCK